MFADDTNLTATGETIDDVEVAINSDLHNLREWLLTNQLSLNVAKIQFMLIGSKPLVKNVSHVQTNIIIENQPIKRV